MILIGLGSNLDGECGSPADTLHECSRLLAESGVYIVNSSNIWKTAPVPASDQPWYRNAVCEVKTNLTSYGLLYSLAAIEEFLGRTRSSTPNEPRVIDLDVLGFNDENLDKVDLKIPHPEMHNRAFVLYPLREVAPNWVHPTLEKTVDEMVHGLPVGQKVECIKNSQLNCALSEKILVNA